MFKSAILRIQVKEKMKLNPTDKSGLPDKVKVVIFNYASLHFRVSMVGRLPGGFNPPSKTTSLPPQI